MSPRRPTKKPTPTVADSLENMLTGMGTATRDPRSSTRVIRAGTMSPSDLDTRYAQHDLEHNIVAIPAEDMVREWIDLRSKEDAGQRLEQALDRLNARTAMAEALTWSRLYGGAIVVVGIGKQRPKVDKAGKPTTEPDLSLPAQPGPVEWLRVLDRHEVTDVELSATGEITHYVVTVTDPGTTATTASVSKAATERIHASRVLRFDGDPMPRRMRDSRAEWGLPVLERCAPRIDDLDTAIAGVAVSMSRFSETVLQLDGLTELLASDGGAGVSQKRLALLNMMRSTFGLVTLDGKDKIAELARSFGGVPEMLDRLIERVASAARMPVSLLMGRSPAGLNATGDSDIRWWYAHVAALQDTKLRPPLWRLIELVAVGEGIDLVETEVSLSFMPLWRPTQKEEAETHATQANADAVYLDRGVVTPEEIRASRFSPTGFSTQTVVDDDMETDPEDIDPDTLDPDELDDEGNPRQPDAEDDDEEDDGAAPGVRAPASVTLGTATAATVPVATDVQKTALNGAQVQAAMGIVADVAAGKIPRDSGVALLVLAFQISDVEAERIMGSAGRGFTPATAPTT